MKTLKRIVLLLVPLLYLSSCYVGVEGEHHGHRYDDDRRHEEHHDHDHEEHHDHDDHPDNH